LEFTLQHTATEKELTGVRMRKFRGLVYPKRCGRCEQFPNNAQKCKKDTKGRGKVYANDYCCDNFNEVEILINQG